MKNLRPFLMMALVAASIGVFTGCATNNHNSYATVDQTSGLEKQQPSPTKDLNAVQTTGYYFGWFSLAALYAWAGGNPSFSP